MKIALLSATSVSLEPIETSFRKIAPDVEYFHLLDTSLLPMLKEEGGITSSIIQRFVKLIDLAQLAQSDAVLFTCSAFNNIANKLQPLYDMRLYRSDEAMLNRASKYKKVGFVSTVEETPIALASYLKQLNPNIHIESVVDDGVIHLLNKGKKEEHDERVIKMIDDIKDQVDVIVLSQYSIAHVRSQVSVDVPILTAPDASVQLCIDDLKE